jgi:hypothetical protein
MVDTVAEHTLYEDAPARVEIEFEYTGSDDLTRVGREILDVEEASHPVLYCECGMEFEAFESAMDHLRDVRE